MCTGRPAFAETQSGEWLDALLHREPLPISELNSEVPVEFQEVVRKAIAKRRFQRYQSANEMLLDVRAVRRKLESDTASGPAYHSQRRPGGWRWYALGGAAALVAAVGIGLSVLREPAASESSMGWRPRQITTSPGWEAEPALSPDGTMIAYTSNQSGNADIWLVDVHGGNPLPLTDHPAVDRDPTWFPDGSEIAFVSERGGQSAIWKMPRLGGSTVLLVPDAVDPAISWDGRFIAFSSPTASGRLRIGVAPTGDVSATRILTGERQGFWDHQDPAWSPDGRSLCFTDFRDLWLVSVDGRKPPHRLTTDHANDRDPAWSPDGRWIYFSSAREGTAALWRVPAEGGRPERQTLGTGPEGEPSTAHQGGRLAYSTYVASQDIAIIDRSTGALASIPGDRLEEGPAVSPDGTRVVFTSNRSGQYDLWRQELDAQRPVGAPTRLSDFEGSVATPSFSPDGAWIVFFRVVDGQRDIWLLPSDGGVPIQITSDPGADIHPSFSPDGSRIAFVSDRDGEFAVWIAPVSKGRRSGSARKLETHREAGAFLPAWSPDGARIAFVSQSEVWIAEVDRPGDAAPVTRGAGARVARWERSGDSLLVSGTWGTDRIELKDLSLTSGEASPLRNPVFQGKGDVPCFFSMSADGRIVAFVQSLENGNIWLVETGGEVR